MARTRQLSERQCDVLHWLAGHSRSDIAERLELPSPAHAQRLVRAALKRLRDRFRDEPALATAAHDEETLS